MYVRFAAAIAALAAGAAGIVVAVDLLRSVPGPTSTSASSPAAPAPTAPARSVAGGRIATPDDPAFPSPPPGAVVLAQEAGTHALALAVKRGLTRVSVLGAAGGGESGLKVSLQPRGGSAITAEPCGDGCYQANVQGFPASPVTVRLDGVPYRFVLPRLPAPDATAAVARATDTWNALETLVWHERLASSPTNALHTVYTAVAPHSVGYDIAGGSSAIIIGGKRWDRSSSNAPWVESVQSPPVRQPQPFWNEVTDAHLLGTGRIGSHPVLHVSFFDPSTPSWFEAWIDRGTGRTLRLDMIAASHFMRDLYGPFDSSVTLTPPT
jgi:hypothetical protein